MKKFYFLLLLAGMGSSSFAQQYIYDIAGNSGGGVGPYIAVRCGLSPLYSSVVSDAQGNIYIPDQGNNWIRKVDTTGVMTTVCGTGSTGYNGDNIPATSASLWVAAAMTLDHDGNMYIADYSNNRVRKVDAVTGLISTIAGTGVWGYNGDSLAPTATKLKDVSGLGLDSSGNLYILDMSNNRVRKLDVNSGLLYTIAGNGTANYGGDGIPATMSGINSARGIAVDPAGNVYIADELNHRIRRVDAATGIITTVAGTGTIGYNGDNIQATTAQLSHPWSVALDAAGNLYIADSWNNRIRKVDTSGIITTIAGTGVNSYSGDGGLAVNATLNTPQGVHVDQQGRIYVSDSYNYRVRLITTYNDTSSVWPGDLDHDGVVDNNDLLPLGMYIYRMGPQRSVMGNSWAAHAAANWGINEQNGNIKHADSNGDGTIDYLDTIAIQQNWNATAFVAHNGGNSTFTLNPHLYFIGTGPGLTAGSTITAELYLGDAITPVEALYGLAFDIGFDMANIQPGSVHLSYPIGILGEVGNGAISLTRIDEPGGVAYGALVHNGGDCVNGYGAVADLTLTLSNTIPNLDSLYINVNAYRVAGGQRDLTTYPLSGSLVGLKDNLHSETIGVYPNPSSGLFNLQYPASLKEEKKTISVYNALGEKVYSIADAKDISSVDLHALVNGVYMLVVETPQQQLRARIVKQ